MQIKKHVFRKEACRSKEQMKDLSRPIRFLRFIYNFNMHYSNDSLENTNNKTSEFLLVIIVIILFITNIIKTT